MKVKKFYLKKYQKLSTFYGEEVILIILAAAFSQQENLTVTEIGKKSGFYITQKYRHMLVQTLLYQLEEKGKIAKIQIWKKNRKTPINKWKLTNFEYQKRQKFSWKNIFFLFFSSLSYFFLKKNKF